MRLNMAAVPPICLICEAVGSTSRTGGRSPFEKREWRRKYCACCLAVDFVEETTPQERLDILRGAHMQFEHRDRGLGLPTKRDRRLIDRLKESGDYDEF